MGNKKFKDVGFSVDIGTNLNVRDLIEIAAYVNPAKYKIIHSYIQQDN